MNIRSPLQLSSLNEDPLISVASGSAFHYRSIQQMSEPCCEITACGQGVQLFIGLFGTLQDSEIPLHTAQLRSGCLFGPDSQRNT